MRCDTRRVLGSSAVTDASGRRPDFLVRPRSQQKRGDVGREVAAPMLWRFVTLVGPLCLAGARSDIARSNILREAMRVLEA